VTGTRTCAHPACSCIAPEKQEYCREICRDSKNVSALACHCDHRPAPQPLPLQSTFPAPNIFWGRVTPGSGRSAALERSIVDRRLN
jgi:hypothetical protein